MRAEATSRPLNRGSARFRSAKVLVRQAIAAGIHWSGLLRLSEGIARNHTILVNPLRGQRGFQRAALPRFAILCYHRIGMGGAPIYSEMPARLFRAHMRFLRKHYRVVSLNTLLEELANPAISGPAVAVTFDDGYGDLYREALPALVDYKIPATVYLTVGCIETGEIAWYDRIFLALQHAPCEIFDFTLEGPRSFSLSTRTKRLSAAVEIITWMRTLPDSVRQKRAAALQTSLGPLPKSQLESRMLNWSQVHKMQDAGVSFGCHTMTHPVVSSLDPEGLKHELVDSKRLLEKRLGAPVFDFAYPFGKPQEMSSAAETVLVESGYRSAVTTTAGLNVPGIDTYRLRRISIGQEHSTAMLGFQLNRLFLRGDAEASGAAFSNPSLGVCSEGRKTSRLPAQGS